MNARLSPFIFAIFESIIPRRDSGMRGAISCRVFDAIRATLIQVFRSTRVDP
jgi:hypothetical protein